MKSRSLLLRPLPLLLCCALPWAALAQEEPALSLGEPTPPTAAADLPAGQEEYALPAVPKLEDELIGIAGGEAQPLAPGSIEAAMATVQEPTDEISDPDERRLARSAFEEAGELFAAGKWAEAKVKYEEVLKYLPKHPAALVNLGLVEERLGNDKAAIEVLERALAVQNDAQPALMSLGLLYSKSGELTKAMARLTRLVELNPKDAKAHNHLGVVFAQRTWRDAAESEFLTALELNPLYQQAHFNLALMYLERRPAAVEQARRHYNTAKELGAQADPEVEAMIASAVNILPGERQSVLNEEKKK